MGSRCHFSRRWTRDIGLLTCSIRCLEIDLLFLGFLTGPAME
jgi:hypothetical protein